MRKEIKQIGNSVGIIFNKEEQHLYKIKVGKTINMTEWKVEKKEGVY